MLRTSVLVKKIGIIAGEVFLAIIYVVSILIMAIGHDSSEGSSFWWRPVMIISGLLLMIVSFYLLSKIGEKDETPARTAKVTIND